MWCLRVCFHFTLRYGFHAWFSWSPVWHIILIVMTLRTVARTFVLDEDEPTNCLIGKERCYGDVTCRILLQTMIQVCDETIYECHTTERLHCHSVLTSLQFNKYFHSCTCDPLYPNARECTELQNFLFLHACLSSHVFRPPSHSNSSRHAVRRPTPEPYPESTDEHDEEHAGEVSCIGVRKTCLLRLNCGKILSGFRERCRENKNQGTCSTPDRRTCFHAIEDLRNNAPELLHCTCYMKRKNTLEKCHRIQAKLANNTCLVSVPYFMDTVKEKDTHFSDLVRMVSEIENPTGYDRESTCIQAFMDCHYDNSCRLRMSKFMSSCMTDRSGICNRVECLDDLQKYYLLVRPELTHAQLFCRCRDGDKKCDIVRTSILPSCARVEDPPPSCHHVIDRCNQDIYCRVRLEAYEVNCVYDKNIGGCIMGPAMCRNAHVGIMGTLLTTNCTCVKLGEEETRTCEDARHRLQHKNICKELSIADFHTQVHTAHRNQDLWAARVVTPERQDCKRHLGQKIPTFMDIPPVIRRYHNNSDCSDLCQCLTNGTLVCRRLPCSPNLSCKHRNDIYAHGSSFMEEHRGQCRCIRAELVCAKGADGMPPKQGLFLHVGYSVSDQYLVEGNSGITFEPSQISNKLGALMNGDTAEQFCRLSLYHTHEGNLVYEIIIPESSPSYSKKDGCIDPAKMISSMINSRNPTILTDAMLSIIKVAQLERIEFHKHSPPPPERSVYAGGATKNNTYLLCMLLPLVSVICDTLGGQLFRGLAVL